MRIAGAGLYADAARQGAPQERQIADRFHLLKNFRDIVERQLGRFEAPVRESPIHVEDDQDTPKQPAIEKSEGFFEGRDARPSGAPRMQCRPPGAV